MSFKWMAPACLLLLSVMTAGCGDEDNKEADPYSYINTPAGILEDLKTAWVRRDSTRYADFFADDYRFHSDPNTVWELPEFWERPEELATVGTLFAAPRVNDIRVILYSTQPQPDSTHHGWWLITVNDEYLEVELKPAPGETEGITLVVDGQINKFWFRKGRTAADTLATSATSQKYYIVEWQDLGALSKPGDFMTKGTSWTRVKTYFRSSSKTVR